MNTHLTLKRNWLHLGMITLLLSSILFGWGVSIKEVEAANLVTNPSFEANGASQTPTGWVEWSSAAHLDASFSEAGGHTGSFRGVHWKASAYDVYTSQTKTGLANGTYTLKAWVQSSGGQTLAVMNVKDYGGATIDAPIPTTGTWTQITINNINVTNGQATFGFYSVASANQWIRFDDVEFYTGSPTATPTRTNTPFAATPTRTNTPANTAPPTPTRTNTPVPGGLVTNPGFEANGASQTPTGWVEWSSAAHLDASFSEAGGHTGSFRGAHWKASAYDVYTSQTKTGLANGTYTLRAWVQSSGGQTTAVMNVKDYGAATIDAPIPTTGSWTQITINNINVTNGQATFGFYSVASANQWIHFDDVEFFSGGGGGNPVPLGIPGSWTLKFADEFNGTSLNTADWWPNWVNASSPTEITVPVNTTEDAAYDPAQVTVSGGTLRLTLISNPITLGGKTYPYRSGMIQTEGRHSCNCPMHAFTFGAFEARIYLPGSGSSIANWPAWWTDGQNWPTDGEMDIMEGLSGSAAYHFHSDTTHAGASVSGNFTGWHTYGSRWQSGRVDFYYDGALVGSLTSGITSSPMYLILNYATGGCCTGPVVVPATMQVDYVRVWQ
jgi:LEA14-like dessication related protein